MFLIRNSIFAFLLLIYFLFTPKVWAADTKIITPVFPIRGSDFFQLKNANPETNLGKEWVEVQKRNFSATWLVRPDALNDENVINLLKSMPKSHEIGIFAEVTPTWAKMAGVKYHEDKNWHTAGSVFLTGYGVSERQKLIDSAFEKFKNIFGYYPKSVGAWWIDGGSLEYMYQKYGILANMDVSDQYTTDNYQVWGQYFSTPFYPSKRNALIPATGGDQKIGVLTIQWATRDPFNSYGNGVLDSTYSVQANDYANKKYHNLSIDYFNKLLSIYLDNPYSQIGQVTIGLENDFSWEDFGGEFVNQLDEIAKRGSSGVRVLSMSEFANLYKSIYPNISPEVAILADDPLGSFGKVLWLQSPRFRIGWFLNTKGSVIRDLRLFYNAPDEPCLRKACENLNLAMLETKNLDEVSFGDSWILDEGKISNIKFSKITDGWKLEYINQAGSSRVIQFLPNDIKINDESKPLSVAISDAINSSKNTPKLVQNFNYNLVNGAGEISKQFKNLIIFLIFVILAFYLPGAALLKKLDLEPNIKFFLSIPLGISVFTLVSFILGFMHLSWGLIILPVLSIIIIKKNLCLPDFTSLKNSLLTSGLILLGSFILLLPTIKNGLLFDYGLGFWGPHGHDAMWHLSLIEGLKNGLPPQNPTFSGTNLSSYHYFFDLLLAEVSKLTNIPGVDLYFRFFPLLISIFIGLLTYILARDWFKSRIAANLSVFFVYCGGSFGWIVSYFRDKTLGGESLFWAQQSISTLINPPFAISLVLFLAGLILLHKFVYQKPRHVPLTISLVILWGTLIEFKAYAGILILGSLSFVSLVEILRRNFKVLKISTPIAILSLAVFLPNNLGSGSLLVFAPFWLIHSMVDSADRLNFYRLSLARMAGVESGNWFKFITSEITGLIIFLIGNLGTRIIGFFYFKSFQPDVFKIFISAFLLISIFIPLLFTQKGAGFNIVQFFYYFIFIFNFFAAVVLAKFLEKFKTFGWIFVGIIIFLSLPTTWDTLHHYIPKRPPAFISQKEIEALEFLKKQPDGVVLSFFDKNLSQKFEAPKPIFAYESTAYVGAFSGKSEYIADTVNLEILGVDYKGRLQAQKDIFSMREPEVLKKILSTGKIKYIYTPKLSGFNPDQEKMGVKKIFENDEVTIFKVET